MRKLQSARHTKIRALQDECRTKNKAFFDEKKAELTKAHAELRLADAELRRLEKSFKASPEVTALKTDANRNVQIGKLKAASKPYAKARSASQRARDQVNGANRATHKKLNALTKDVPELVQLDAKIHAARNRVRALSPNSRQYAAERTKDLQGRVNMADRKLADVVKGFVAASAPEHNWLRNLIWTVNIRHYNYPYKDYIKKEVVAKLGLKIRLCDEDFKALESILEKHTDAKWHSRVDWEWRMKQEVDGSIQNQPGLQKWIKRARGE